MTKYMLGLVLVALLALENQSVFNRLHVNSEVSTSETNTVASYVRRHPRRGWEQPQPEPTHPTTNSETQLHHHKNERHRAHKRRENNHRRAHFQHKKEHAARQKMRQLEQQQQSQPKQDIRTAPKIWQHLYEDYPSGLENVESIENVPPKVQEDSSEMYLQAFLAKIHSEQKVAAEDSMFGDDPMLIQDEWPSEAHVSPIVEETAEELAINSIEPRSVSDVDSIKKVFAAPCPQCNGATPTEEELTALRKQWVKNQILERLRLKEPPVVRAVQLPKPIYEGTTIEHESAPKELDDYYARTSKKFIFLEKEETECQRLGGNTSLCFSFKIDDNDAEGLDVSNAVLWLFKNKQIRDVPRNSTLLQQQTIVVSEVQQAVDQNYLPIVKTIAIQSIDAQDKWMKIDIEWPIKRWFGNHDLSHLIQISCQSCDLSSMNEMISSDKDYRPFIMINTQNRRRSTRQKRSLNCGNGVTECCREKLYIDFDEIGWGDWIVQPRGYDAYFCRGNCSPVATLSQPLSQHTVTMQQRLFKNGTSELKVCCTAKQYSSLQMVIMDSKDTATQMTFPNMVVESCGCK